VNVGVAGQFNVPFAPAAPIVGGTLSIMVITWDNVAEWLPHASVASQLRVIVLKQLFPMVTSPKKLTVAPLHASVAVGAVNAGVPVQLMVAFAPAPPIVGPTLSTMVIVCDTVAE